MKVQANQVVSIHYTLRDDAGVVIDSSEGRDALEYIQGKGMIVPGLEAAMLDKALGEKFKVTVSPAEGYGESDPNMIQEIPIDAFQGAEVEPGMQFVARGPQGQMMITVTEVKGTTVIANGNHPLAGKNLNFEIEVAAIREATSEELENGLGGGCCGGHGGCGCHGEEEGDGSCGDECGCGDEEVECCGGKGHDDGSECCGGKGHGQDESKGCCGGKGH